VRGNLFGGPKALRREVLKLFGGHINKQFFGRRGESASQDCDALGETVTEERLDRAAKRGESLNGVEIDSPSTRQLAVSRKNAGDVIEGKRDEDTLFLTSCIISVRRGIVRLYAYSAQRDDNRHGALVNDG